MGRLRRHFYSNKNFPDDLTHKLCVYSLPVQFFLVSGGDNVHMVIDYIHSIMLSNDLSLGD